jgi:DNA gyrase subunit A
MKVTDKTGQIITSQSVTDSDNIIVTTTKGIVMRSSTENIRIMGRATQGVRIINLHEGDAVSDLIRIPQEEEVEKKVEEKSE